MLHKPVMRDRAAGAQWPEQDWPERDWPEYVHLLARLCVILAVGALLTGIGVTVAYRMHPTTAPAPLAATVAPASKLPATDGEFSEPPWAIPLPTASPAPSTTGSPSAAALPSAAASPSASVTPSRPASTAPRPSATPLPADTTPSPTPVLLGPGGDDAVEAALTGYCVHRRGQLAVATLDYAARTGSGWGCRYGDNTTALSMKSACRWLYGDNAWPKSLNDTNPYGWRCFRNRR